MRAALGILALAGCHAATDPPRPDAPPTAVETGVPPIVPQSASVRASAAAARFDTREAMLAGAEMQQSGEPLAEAMGRDLGGYLRDILPTDQYFDLASGALVPDPVGFSIAVESYEYSKQPMNAVAFELAAGTSLVHGPSAAGLTGKVATDALAARFLALAAQTGADARFVAAPGSVPDSPLGWPGIWPVLHPFTSFDPTIDPTGAASGVCALVSDDGGGTCGDYECIATTLHLRDRASQADWTIGPGADGFTTWKSALWAINYLQVMHTGYNQPVAAVDDADVARVGTPDNDVQGVDEEGDLAVAGTWLGSTPIEGFQAGVLLEEADQRATDWLTRLSTSDGVTLGGFASVAEATSYGTTSPLRWLPASIAVTESDDGGGFPVPAYALAGSGSALRDLSGVLLGYATLYALTDATNPDVGGASSARAYLDGDPFAADDGLPDGEATLHDRSLALIRVAGVNLARLHVDPTSGALADDVAFAGAVPTRGTTASTVDLAYAIVALRTTGRALSGTLALYSNGTPDTAGLFTPLDALPLGPGEPAFSARLHGILVAEADLLLDHLTDPDGRAYTGWDLARAAPVDDADTLDAHAAAIRGLLAAYLATGDTRFRDRAVAVYDRMERVFYDPAARLWSVDPAPVDATTFTPLRFALLQGALRETYELVAARPGGEALAPAIEAHLGRLDKLVLNGWDDRDEDGVVAWPDECVRVVDGLPRGGLQSAERALTGEVGYVEELPLPGTILTPASDREHDCVPEIDDAHLPAALGASLTLTVER